MNPILILALMQAPVPAVPINEVQSRDIGCVALFGIIADEQRRAVPGSNWYPDVRETGRRWAGIVGQRVMDQTGQPRELVALAIQQAVADIQADTARKPDAQAAAARFRTCKSAMDADLAAVQPLPKPERAQ
jgi:hypothetical protein